MRVYVCVVSGVGWGEQYTEARQVLAIDDDELGARAFGERDELKLLNASGARGVVAGGEDVLLLDAEG